MVLLSSRRHSTESCTRLVFGSRSLPPVMKTTITCFPFDLFGSSGTSAGATLLIDELRELLADNRRETAASRASLYTPHVRLREISFDTLKKLNTWRSTGRRLARQLLQSDDFFLWLSGNHLGALPIYDELSALGDAAPLVLQFDAHLDIHQFADCTRELSHGNFLLHCAGPLPSLINIGHRDLLLPEKEIHRHFTAAYSAIDAQRDPTALHKSLDRHLGPSRRIILDIDSDVFDPSSFPAVAQPVPFGLMPREVLQIIEAIGIERIAGILLSEFDPPRDDRDRSLAILVWLLEYLLLRRYSV